MSFKLQRTKQCSKCPWKASTNPNEIPDGYCQTKHRNLESTIAKPGEINIGKELRIMACHHSFNESPEYCIGWLHNQMGVGNNILLRLKMRDCENFDKVKVYGKQHPTFNDTLPK